MNTIQIHNSLTRTKEVFTPANPSHVNMYVCGPTVYNFIHIGNARPYVFFDVVRRFLEHRGYKVTQVVNFTDVDDKIIAKAQAEGVRCDAITERYCAEYLTDMQLLKVKEPAKRPRVTDHIPEIIRIIEGLIEKGFAYEVDGEVLYAVRKFPGYGKLSGKNIDDLIAGARVEPGIVKRDPVDFSLWKPQKGPHEPAWDSPWGKGRPGWHIECSAMAIKYLGESFDIHGGGMDLIHPHHENEIAQSEGFTGKTFARYWMHNNMLTFNAEKMSKSLGNILLTRDFVKKYGAETLKFMLLSGHYRSSIDFSEKHIRENQAALHRIYSALRKAREIMGTTVIKPGPEIEEEKRLAEMANTFQTRWESAMDDDFNTAKALGYVFEYVRAFNALADKKGLKMTESVRNAARTFVAHFEIFSKVFNLTDELPDTFLKELRKNVLTEKGLALSDIEALLTQRLEARKQKNFALSDQIRADLLTKGIELRDTPAGTDWDVVFA